MPLAPLNAATGTSWSATYPQKIYGISLFVIDR